MRTITLFLVFFGTLATSAANADTIVSWGYDDHNQVSGTPSGTGYTAIAGGGGHSLALAADGSIESWGAGNDFYNLISGTPSGTGFTAIAGGGYHSLALQVQAGPTVPEGPAASKRISPADGAERVEDRRRVEHFCPPRKLLDLIEEGYFVGSHSFRGGISINFWPLMSGALRAQLK